MQRFVASAARRALETTEIIASELGCEPTMIVATPDLYRASASQLGNFLRTLEPELHSIVLVAHNPAITELCNTLCMQTLMSMPPAGVARLRLAIDDWRELKPGCGRLEALDYPRGGRGAQ